MSGAAPGNVMAKILIIDDAVELVKLMQMRLEASNYEVITASDALKGYN